MNCLICPHPGTPANHTKSHYVPPHSNSAYVSGENPYTHQGIADAVITFMLGAVNGVNQMDVYSTVNMFKIRTIPGNRWNNPVLVGAGNGYVAVVDRFSDYDLIRITDEFAGAGPDNFDNYGHPMKGVDFSTFTDQMQIATPPGTQVTGLKVLPNSVLLAGLSGGKTYQILKHDLSGEHRPISAYQGLVPFQSAVINTLGYSSASFSVWDEKIGSLTGTKVLGACWEPSTYGATLIVFDYLTGDITGTTPLHINLKPISVHQHKHIVSVLMADPETNKAVCIVRFRSNNKGSFLPGTNAQDFVPAPQFFNIQYTFQPQDIKTLEITDAQLLKIYRSLAKSINSKPGIPNNQDYPVGVIDPSFFPIRWKVPTNSVDIVNGRSQSSSTVTAFLRPGKTFKYEIAIMSVPEDVNLLCFDGTAGTIVEAYTSSDPTNFPLMAFHSGNYDWLSSGGMTYGCQEYGGFFEGHTDEIVPISIATDISIEPGLSRLSPDLKVGIIDTVTGLVIYNSPKPKGWKYYGGNYVTVVPVNPLTQTLCGQIADAQASELDGVFRIGMASLSSSDLYNALTITTDPITTINIPINIPGNTSLDYPTNPPQADNTPLLQTAPTSSTFPIPVKNFSSSTDYNEGWAYFKRRVETTEYVPVLVSLTEDSWTIREQDSTTQFDITQPILPQWNLPSPITAVSPNPQGIYHVQGSPAGTIICSGARGGFFSLTLPKEQISICTILQSEIEYLQNKINQEKNTDTAYQIPNDQITLNNLQIQSQFCNVNDPTNLVFSVYPSYRSAQFKIDACAAQIIDPISGEVIYDTGISTSNIGQKMPVVSFILPGPYKGAELSLVPINGKNCAIAINPNIRSWINLEIILSAWNNGAGGGNGFWVCDERLRGKFGVNLGGASSDAILHDTYGNKPYPFCGGLLPGNVYDAGDTASSGAIIEWDLEVLFNGKPIRNTIQRVTYEDEIISLAPGDAQELLLNTFNTATDDVDPETGLHIAEVYFSEELINTVTIRAKLYNVAFDVYRFGVKTFSHCGLDKNGNFAGFASNSGPDYPESAQGRYGADPGFYWGDNCEGFCFGNVQCNYQIFQGDKLCQEDPVDPVVRNLIWEGEATYTIPDSNNPYATAGIAVGNLMDTYFNFTLNAGAFDYRIDLRHGIGRTQTYTKCQIDSQITPPS